MSQSIVSVIIPCRNEEKFIAKCLDSILLQDYPKESLEILVVDGASTDKTKEIIKSYTEKYPFIRLLENPQKFTPFGLNIGIKNSKGETIVRMDAHAGYQKDYISKCAKYLKDSGADNIGGTMKTLPAKNTLMAKAIAFSLSSRFGAASSFRIGSLEPQEVDTVFGGCYKRDVFDRIGFFNEKLTRSQDMEFNLRLKKSGGKIMLFPDVVSYYYPKSKLPAFLKHNFQDGIWSVYPLKFIKTKFKLRHYIPLIFVGSLIGAGILSVFCRIFLALFFFIIFSYLFLAAVFSFKTAKEEKDFRFLFIMPVVFASRHIVYGLGSLWGLLKLI